MPRTTQCPSCGVVLNIPKQVMAGKRLRCPKCAFRFRVTEADASSASTLAAPFNAESAQSSHQMPSRPTTPDDLPLPVAEGDLREAFDLPLADVRSLERTSAAASSAPAPSAMGDAAALFQEEPRTRRRPSAAEARSHARRCCRCGGFVPQGMSICAACGTDQETGMRVGLEDDLAPPPPPPPSGPPMHIAAVGGLLGVAALILLILSLIRSVGGGGEESLLTYGWLCLAVVSGFALFSVVQFIRLKSAKLLMVALTLGAVINVLALVVLPLAEATWEDTGQVIQSVNQPDDDPESLGVQFNKPLEDRIDTRRITTGVTVLILYAGLSIYLMSPAVKRPMHRSSAASESW